MLALSGLGVAGIGSIVSRRRRMTSRLVRALGEGMAAARFMNEKHSRS